MRKTSSTVTSPKHSKRFSPARQRLLFALLTFSSLTSGSAAWAGGAVLPQGGHFVGGTGAIAPKGSNGLSISQTTQTGVIDWNSFSIGKGNSVTIANGNGATLNEVTGGNLSTIAGSLKATGSVYVVNTAGLVVSGSGKVVAGGTVVLSSRDVSTSAFMAGGSLEATGASAGTVVNQGSITSTNGDVVLVGKSVTNSGAISASKGTATLAAGDDVLLQADGDDTVLVKSGSGDVTNSGTVEAAQVALNAAGGNVYALAVNNGGVIRATGTATKNGHVYLTAGDDLTVNSSVSATNADGSGGAIVATATTVSIGGGARISANGTTKGGTVLIGGDRHGGQDRSVALSSAAIADATKTTVAKGAKISADGGAKGDGGDVVIWSNQSTSFAGSISAKGGKASGNGGFVEVSSEQVLSLTGAVSTRAAHGTTGTLLLDPADVTIYSNTDPGPNTTANTTYILNTDLDNQLNSNNVTITTSGAIHFGTNNSPAGGGSGAFLHSAPIFWTQDFSLTLNAGTFIDTPGGNPSTATGGFNPSASSTLINSEAGGAITFNASGTGLTAAATVISLTGDVTGSGGTISLLSQGATYRVEIGNNTSVVNTNALGAGTIILQGDQVRLGTGSGPTALVQTPGEVDVVPFSGGAVIVGDIDTSGQYGNNDNTTLIRSEDIINVHANLLVIGSTTTTDMTLTTANRAGESAQGGFPTIDAAYVNNLELLTGTSGSVTQDANTAIVVHDVNFQNGTGAQLAVGDGGLAVQTGGAITLNSAYNSVGTIAFTQTGTGGNISFTRQGDQDPSSVGLIVGDVAGIRGITTAGAGSKVTISVNETTANPSASDPGSSISSVALGGIAVTQSSGADSISTPNLDLEGAGSSFALDNTSNAFNKVAGTVASLSLHDNIGLTTATIGTSSGINATGDITVVDNGNLTLGNGAAIATTGGNVRLEDQIFTNNDVTDGANALVATGGSWRVYSQDPTADTDRATGAAALSYSFVQYAAANSYANPFTTANAVVSGDVPAGTASGNGFIYSVTPTLKETVSGQFNKVYDQTTGVTGTLATGAGGNYTVTQGGINSDTITFSNPTGSIAGLATYASANAGNNIVISLTNPITATAKDANGVAVFGYGLTVTSTLKGNITPLGLTVSGTRAYDGLTDAAGSILTTITGELSGDGTLTVTGSGVLASKDASTTPTNISTLTGLSLSGTNAGNYKITSGTVTVTPLDVSLTGTRVYDGLTDASSTILTITGKIAGDSVSVSGSGVLASKNASTTATNISDLSGLSLTGADAGDYHIASGTVTVTPLGLTVSGTRVYDGLTDASGTILTSITGEISGDGTLTVGGSGVLASKNASTTPTNISTLTGLTLSGANAGNYKITSGTVTVTPLGLTVSGTRTYDGTTTAAGGILTTITGEISGDGTLTVGGSGVLASKDASTTPTNISTLTGLTLSGTNAGNYKITSGTVTVTPLSVTVTGTRGYDGGTDASGGILSVVGEISGDGTLTVTGSGTLAGKNASTTPTNIASLGNLGLTGTNAGDYKIASGTVTVTPINLTVTPDAFTRAFDGSTTDKTLYSDMAGNYVVSGLVGGETLGNAGSALFLNGSMLFGGSSATVLRNAASYSQAQGTLALGGSGAGNYTLTFTNPNHHAYTITPETVTIVGLTGIRVYDGMTDANSSILTLSNIATGDQVTLSGTGILANKNVGKETITGIGSLALGGANAGNYEIVVGRPDTYVTVTPATLTISAVTQTKIYDGTVTSTDTPTVVGLLTGDSITGTLMQAYGSKDVLGTNGSTLTAAHDIGVSDGNSGANYNIVYKTAVGTITPEAITISATTQTKVYDGTTTSTEDPTITAGQLFGGDTLTGLSQAYNSKNVLGTNGSTLTVNSGYTLTDAGNYSVTVKTAQGTITPLAIIATGTRVYDGDPDAPGSILNIINGIPGDEIGLTGTGTLGSKHVGTHDVTDPGTLTLTGTDKNNYTLTGGTETVKITPFAVVLYGTRVYDGVTDGDSGILAVTNAFAGDTVTVASGTSTIANRDVGNEGITNFGTLTLGGASAGDYTLVGAKGVVKVTPEMLTVTAVPGTKTYDGTTTSDGTPIVTTGTIFGPDTGTFIQTYGNPHAGTSIQLTPSGSVSDGNGGKNYVITYVPISTGIIDPLAVILSGTRVVDNQTDANSGILTITNLIPGDTASVSGNGVLKAPDVGPEQIVDFGGLTLQGPSAGDYTLVGATGIVTITPLEAVPPVNIPNTQTASGPDNVAYDAGIIKLTPRQNGIVTGTIATIDGTDYHPDSQLGCTLGDAGCIQNGVAPTTTSTPPK